MTMTAKVVNTLTLWVSDIDGEKVLVINVGAQQYLFTAEDTVKMRDYLTEKVE